MWTSSDHKAEMGLCKLKSRVTGAEPSLGSREKISPWLLKLLEVAFLPSCGLCQDCITLISAPTAHLLWWWPSCFMIGYLGLGQTWGLLGSPWLHFHLKVHNWVTAAKSFLMWGDRYAASGNYLWMIMALLTTDRISLPSSASGSSHTPWIMPSTVLGWVFSHSINFCLSPYTFKNDPSDYSGIMQIIQDNLIFNWPA